MPNKKLPVLAMILAVVAAGIAAYGYARDGFWLGVIAMFLLWWADNDRKQSRAKASEADLIAEHVPELIGKDFVQASAYILEEIDRFKVRTGPPGQERLFEALSQHQAKWKRRGEPMPPWATLKLLREIEAELQEGTLI